MVTALSYVGVALVSFVLGKWISHRRQVAAAFAAGGAAHAKSVALAQGGSVIFNGYPNNGAGAIDYDIHEYHRGGHDDDRAGAVVHDEFDRLRREHVARVLPIRGVRRPDGLPSGGAGDADADSGRGVGVARSPVVERSDSMTVFVPPEAASGER